MLDSENSNSELHSRNDREPRNLDHSFPFSQLISWFFQPQVYLHQIHLSLSNLGRLTLTLTNLFEFNPLHACD